jgi:hypothetical protein
MASSSVIFMQSLVNRRLIFENLSRGCKITKFDVGRYPTKKAALVLVLSMWNKYLHHTRSSAGTQLLSICVSACVNVLFVVYFMTLFGN